MKDKMQKIPCFFSNFRYGTALIQKQKNYE